MISRSSSLGFTRRSFRNRTVIRENSTAKTGSPLHLLLTNPELTHADAQNELRWIREHVARPRQSSGPPLGHTSLTKTGMEGQVVRLCKRRAEGEPLQYILGTTDFGPLTVRCRAPVLIPRPETAFITERLAESILAQPDAIPQGGLEIVDLCTGSGCILLLLAHLLRSKVKRLRGYDISSEAITLAEENIEETAYRGVIDIKQGDIFDPGLVAEIGKVDLVVSNPPYIPLKEWETLPRSVRDYEDRLALVGGGERGLAYYHRIGEMLPHILTPMGRVALEVGLGQAGEVAGILTERGEMTRTEIWEDQYGRERMVVGWR